MINEKNQIAQILQEPNKEENQKSFLTVVESCSYLSVSPSFLYKKMSNREIPYYKPGGKKAYFMKEDLDTWVFSKKVDSAEELRSRADEALERYGRGKQFSTAKNNGTKR
jgi:excisionase family DNA binding protein